MSSNESSSATRQSRTDNQRIRLQKLLLKERSIALDRAASRKMTSEDLNEDKTRLFFSQMAIKGNENDSNYHQVVNSDHTVLDASGLEALSKSCTYLQEVVEGKTNYEDIGYEIQINQRNCFSHLGVGYVQLWHTPGVLSTTGKGGSSVLSCTRLDGLKVTLGDSATTNALLGLDKVGDNSDNFNEADEESAVMDTSTHGIQRICRKHPLWAEVERAMKSVAIADYTSNNRGTGMGDIESDSFMHSSEKHNVHWRSILIAPVQSDRSGSGVFGCAVLLAAECDEVELNLPSRHAARRLIQTNTLRIRSLFSSQCLSRLRTSVLRVVTREVQAIESTAQITKERLEEASYQLR